MSFRNRCTTSAAGLVVVALFASLATAAPAIDVSQLQVVIWSDTGAMVSDADVVARDASGEFVKLDAMPNGSYILGAVGVKSELLIGHATLGSFSADLPLVHDSGRIRLDVVFSGVDEAEVFSPNLLPPLPSTGDGGAPSNDLCANAIPVAVGSTTAGSTSGASVDGVGTCGTSEGTGGGVWYTVTGTGTTMTATTCGAFFGYDTKISVFCGPCDALTCIAGNDDSCIGGASGLLSTVNWCSQAGATYRILVHGFGSATGPFNLTVSAGTAPCTPTVNCIPPTPTGACCFEDGSCEELTREECEEEGGDYQGDDTDCTVGGGATAYDSGALNLAIADGLGTGIPGAATTHSINVPAGGTVADVDIDLTVNHTWTGDLIVTVSHGGTTVTIIDRPGVPASTFGCSADNWSNIILDDEAPTGIEGQCLTNLTGSYSPNNPLSAFDGLAVGGDWTISITDNAGADLGSLVSWSVHVDNGTTGTPICPQPECHLVIGSGPGSDDFFASWHAFSQTQVEGIVDSYPVLLEDIPEFVLPAQQTTGRVTYPVPGALGQAGFGATSVGQPGPVGDSPAWMASGSFAVQVLMWNPQVFPYLPEQSTPGLHVYLMADGTVRTVPFGTSVGGLDVWHEIDTNAAGQKVIRFPFSIPGF